MSDIQHGLFPGFEQELPQVIACDSASATTVVRSALPENSALPQQRRSGKIPHSRKSHPLWARTEVYTSHKVKYARFRWGRGRETYGYVHISGGAASTRVVQYRRAMVDRLLAQPGPLEDRLQAIFDLLRNFEDAPVGRPPNF